MGSIRDEGATIVYRSKGIHHVTGEGSRVEGSRVFDDFLGDTLDANLWSSVADTGCTAAAINVQRSGVIRMTTDTTDDDRVDFAGEIIWRPSLGLVFETRIKVDDVTNVALNVGLSDAKSEAAQTIGVALSGTTFTTVASNGVFWVFDTDATTDTWRGIGVKADTDSTARDSAIAPVNDTYQRFRIEVDTSGNATFKILNDADPSQPPTYVAHSADACTATTLLTPYIAVANRSGTAHNLDVDYVYIAALSR